MDTVIEQINSAGKTFVEFAWPMLWQSSVLIAILLAADWLLRRRVRAVFRYWLWMLVLAKLFLPTSLSSPVSIGLLTGNALPAINIAATEQPVGGDILNALPNSPRTTETGEASVALRAEAPIQSQAVTPVASLTRQGGIFLVWLMVVCAMLLLLMQRAVFVCGLVRQSAEATGLMNDALKFCCNQMGVRQTIGLKVSPNATSPAVCGLFRPVILVPQGLGSSLGINSLRVVLMHELAHIKRGDLWVNLLQTVLQIAYFYNPLLWVANWVIRRVREQAVDEAVQVALGERANQYPETLLNVARLAFERPALSLRLIGVVESKSALTSRIKRMLTRPIPKTAKLGIIGSLAIVLWAFVLLPMAKAAPSPEFVIKGTVTDAQTGKPIAGAKVGDEKYAGGKYGAVTDSSGNYSYKTWYEEHGIIASAEGYKTQTNGFNTKLFGSEKEKIINFQLAPDPTLQPATSNSVGAFQPQRETSQENGRRPVGNCSISGKVVSAEDGRLVDNATVYLFCAATHDPIFIQPASDGSFEFKNIPSGQFSLQVIHTPGYQNEQYNPENTKGPLPFFKLKDGEQRSGIVFELKRSFTISGKVFDENGKPYANETCAVKVWHQSQKDGGPGELYHPNGHQSQIAADGSYLIEALDGSPVYVMVQDWDCANKDDYYPPCYYPGTVSRKEAKLITFDSAKAIENIDIKLIKKGPCAIEGTVTDLDGNPIQNALVAVHHTEMLFDAITAYTDANGLYRINSIGPGDYLVHADAEPFGYVRSRQSVVIETGIKKVDFTLTKAVKISGKIVDASGKAIDVGPSALGWANVEGASDESSSWSGRANRFHDKFARMSDRFFVGGQGDYHSEQMDFPTSETFVIQGMPAGRTILWFEPKNLSFKVTQILYNGQDITKTIKDSNQAQTTGVIETEAGQDITDVAIIVARTPDPNQQPADFDSVSTGQKTREESDAKQPVINASEFGGSKIIRDESGKVTYRVNDKITLEILGITNWPVTKESTWWSADGTVLNKPALDAAEAKIWDNVNFGKDQHARYYLVVCRSDKPEDATVRFHAKSVSGNSVGVPAMSNKEKSKEKFVYVVAASEETVKTGGVVLTALAADGDWKTVDKFNIGGDAGTTGAGFTYTTTATGLGKTTITLNSTKVLTSNRTEGRVVAVDKNGRMHTQNGRASVSNNILYTQQLVFDVPKDSIDHLEIQERPYMVYEFRNVSFEPGAKTDVQVEVGKTKADTLLPNDYSSVTVQEGVGFDDLIIGDANCTGEFIKAKLGEPEQEQKNEKEGWWIVYHKKYGLDFWLNLQKNTMYEIRLNKGFKGKLSSGISMSSTKQEVFAAYGKPIREEAVDNLGNQFDDRVLFIRKDGIARIDYREKGVLFWFEGDKINQIRVGAVSSPGGG